MSQLEVRLRHRFATFELDVEFATPAAGVTALFGPSGAGKSTVVNAIAGLFEPDEGVVRIGADVLLDTDAGRRMPVHTRRIGYVFQDARLFPHLSVRDNCLFGARRAARPPSSGVVDDIVDLLDLGPLLTRMPANLSGGERQRVALARAVLCRPRLLLLDEPLASLDVARKREVLPYLERLQRSAELPMILVSHAPDEVTRLARRMVVLDGGCVRAQGAVDEVMARPDLFPVRGPVEAGAVVDGVLRAHHDREQLSEVVVGATSLWLPRVARSPGEDVRLRIRARDVIVALTEPRDISANNVLAGTVAALGPPADGYVEVQIDCGDCRLLASITQRSCERLMLCAGRAVYAIVKTVNLG